MECNLKKQPTAKTIKGRQFDICNACSYLKNKERWCGYWGFWLKNNKVEFPAPLKIPPKKVQAKNFAKAVVKRVKNMKNRNPEEIEKLKAICKPCDAYYTKGITPRCTYCGCCVNLKTKWASEDCPIGKW